MGSRSRRRSAVRPGYLLLLIGPNLITASDWVGVAVGDEKPGVTPVLDAPLLLSGDSSPPPPPPPTVAAPSTPASVPGSVDPIVVPAPSSAGLAADLPARVPGRSTAVLAIPGLGRPAPSTRRAATSAPELIAPLTSADVTPSTRTALDPTRRDDGRDQLPSALPEGPGVDADRVIVSRPAGPDLADGLDLNVPSLGIRDNPLPSGDPFPLRTAPLSAGVKPSTRIEPTLRGSRESGQTAGGTPRRRLFGLLPPVPAAVRPLSAPKSSGDRSSASSPGSLDHDESEAIAQETQRRRIEKQARLAAGDRARSVEVQLDQKLVTVRATGVRFLQKKAVRKSLESLPALAGLHSTIEVLD